MGGSDQGGGKVAATVKMEGRAPTDGSYGCINAVVLASSQHRLARRPPPCL